jgi:hypothetical protein
MCRYCDGYLNRVLAPEGEALSFASAKESAQRKGDSDAACFLRSGFFIGGCQKGVPVPLATRGFPAAPLRAIPDKNASVRRGITGFCRHLRNMSYELQLTHLTSWATRRLWIRHQRTLSKKKRQIGGFALIT